MDTIHRENPCLVLVLAALSAALSVGGVRACVNRYIVRKGGDDDRPPTQSKKSLEEKTELSTAKLSVCVSEDFVVYLAVAQDDQDGRRSVSVAFSSVRSRSVF